MADFHIDQITNLNLTPSVCLPCYLRPPPPPATQMPDLVPQLDPSERYMQCCEACAFNVPALLLLAGGDLSRSNLHATFTDLVFDPHPPVRRLIAAGFHEVSGSSGCVV